MSEQTTRPLRRFASANVHSNRINQATHHGIAWHDIRVLAVGEKISRGAEASFPRLNRTDSSTNSAEPVETVLRLCTANAAKSFAQKARRSRRTFAAPNVRNLTTR